jgi:hypothetical protein
VVLNSYLIREPEVVPTCEYSSLFIALVICNFRYIVGKMWAGIDDTTTPRWLGEVSRYPIGCDPPSDHSYFEVSGSSSVPETP